MFLIYENKEVRVSRDIGWFLKNEYKNIVKPKNICIYSSSISKADTACIIRSIVKNRVVFYPMGCIVKEFFDFYLKKQKGVIFVANQKQIERIIRMINSGDYEIIAKKKIVSINL